MGAHITALTGLTTPVPLTGGGTGATTPAAGLTALGGAALAGSASQTFSVGYPTAPAHAMPLAGSALNAQWFGATGNGTTDDTTAIRNWLTALGALTTTRAVGVLPMGTYLIDGPLTVPRSNLIIEGNGSKIVTNNATADIFVGATALTQLCFRDLSFDATVTKTAGSAFDFSNIANSSFQNCKLASVDDYNTDGSAKLWNGFNFGVLSRVWIDRNCTIIVQNYGVQGSDSTNASGELQIDGRIIFCTRAVYLGGGYGGVYLNGEISRGSIGLYVDSVGAGIANREVFCLPGAIIDSCDNYGVVIESNGCALLDITGSWMTSTGQFNHSAQGVGLYIAPTTGDQVVARITGARFYNNFQAGAVVAAGYVNFSGCYFDSIAGNALTIEDSNFTGVSGCSFVNNSGFAIWFNTSTTINDFLIEGNVFSGNETGQVNLTTGSSSTQIIQNNLGFVTENSGVAQITTGNSTVVVSHGLVATPAVILVTCASAPLAVCAINATSTQFTIEVASAVGGPANFNWRASLAGN